MAKSWLSNQPMWQHSTKPFGDIFGRERANQDHYIYDCGDAMILAKSQNIPKYTTSPKREGPIYVPSKHKYQRHFICLLLVDYHTPQHHRYL